MNNDKKIVPELRFPEFINDGEWQYLNGDELFEPISNRDHNSDMPILAISQEHGAIPREIINYTVIASEESIKSYKLVEQGDFIISLRSFQGGIEYSNYKGICSPAYIVLRKKKKLEDIFFKYYFKTDLYIRQLNKNLEGIRDGKMVSYSQFSEILLPYPSIYEQQKIASSLSSIDALIEAQSQKFNALKDHKKGLMQKLFPQKGEKVPKFRFPEFVNDEAWIFDELSIYAEIVDPHPSHRAPTEVREGIPFIGIGDISEQGFLDTKKVRLVSKEIYEEHAERYKLKIGDFAYGRVASIGKVVDLSNNINKIYTYSPTMAIIQPKEIDSSFLRHFCNSPYFITQVEDKTTGSTRNSIGIQNLRILKVGIPKSSKEQQKIASCLSSLDNLIKGQSDKIEQLKEHKKGLLQNLFPNNNF